MKHVGKRGSLETLPGGTVEAELAERGERLYTLGELPELLEEIRRGAAAGTDAEGQEQGREEAPAAPAPVLAEHELRSLFDDLGA